MKRIVVALLLMTFALIGVASAVKTVSPNYAELTSPIAQYNNTVSEIAFADIPKDGLVLWLPFDEGWGYIAHDLAEPSYEGIGYNGTIQQINWTIGVQGGAVKLDGIDDYIQFPSNSKLNITDQITIAFWFYSDDITQTWKHVFGISNGTALGTSWRIRIGGATDVYFQAYDDSGNQIYFGTWNAGLTLADYGHAWHFFVFIYDSVNDIGKVYMDGKLIWSGLPSGSGAGNPIRTLNSPFTIGANSAGLEKFNGTLDNIMIYSRALTDEEIKKIYEATKPKYDINDGLVLYLPFDEMSGSVAHDLSGNGNDGTGYNGTTLQINWTGGIYGGAVKFDGVDDYVVVGDVVNSSQAFTVAAWVSAAELKTTSWEIRIITKRGVVNEWSIFQNSGTKIGFAVWDTADNFYSVFSPDVVEVGKWIFITAVYDGANTIKLYIDGDLVNLRSDVANVNYGGASVVIGGGNYNGREFHGIIDELRIYNRALNDSEIRYLYELGKSKLHLEQGLVLHLTFNEPYGTDVYNYASTNVTIDKGTFYGETFNDGTIYNATWTDGKLGKALKFDGDYDYVEVPSSASLNVTNFTISVWVKLNSTPDALMIFVAKRYSTLRDSYTFAYRLPNLIRLNILDADGTTVEMHDFYLPENLQTGIWYNFVVTRDASTGTIKFYMNGELIDTETTTASPVFSAEPLYIGADYYNGMTNFFDGLIDEVRIYNRALSDEEIKQIYENNAFIRDGLVAYWRFDEGSGTIAHDTHHIAYETNGDGAMAGKAMSFDGVDDYVEVPDSPSLNITQEITIAMWFKSSQTPSGVEQFVTGKYTPWSAGYVLAIKRDSGVVRFSWYNGSVGNINFDGITKVTDGTWHFIVATFDKNGFARIYIDGKLDKEQQYTYRQSTSTTNPLKISANSVIAFNVDELRIYNRALSPEEIKALYLLTKNKYDSEFKLVNYTVSVTPETPNELKFVLTPQNELTDIQKLVFLPAAAAHSYTTISTEIDNYGNKVQAVETSDESPTFTIEIPDLSPAPDGVAMAVWEYTGTLRFVADPDVYDKVKIIWGIFDWILSDFTQMFIHRDNELKPGDIFEFPDVQLTIAVSGCISSSDPIEKTYRGLIVGGSEFAAIPSAEAVIFLNEFNPEKIREGTSDLLVNFTVDTEYHDQNITFIITNLPPSTNFTVFKNGEEYMTVRTNNTGVLKFTDSEFSPTTFVIKLEAPAIIVAPPMPKLPDLSAAVQYVSYALAGILTFLTILLAVRKIKGAS